MIRTVCVISALALTLAACGGGSGPGSTPEDTFESARSAIENKNWGAIADLVPPSVMEKQEKDFEVGKSGPGAAMMAAMAGISADELKDMTFRDFMAQMMEKMSEKDPEKTKQMLEATIVKSDVNGDMATLTIKTGDKEEKVKLKKENGLWYMADFN